MDADEVWRTIDQQRAELADLMETFTEAEWASASLCEGWRVCDVAAHLTLSHTGALAAAIALARARGSFSKMIHDTGVQQAELPVEDFPVLLRAMIGSRRKAPGVTMLEPLIDVLVHAQDMVVPLGRTRDMPGEPAATAAQRAWSMGWPFRARKRLRGFSLAATDHTWSVGEGDLVEGPVRAMLMLVTGRDVVLPELTGPGVHRLRKRLVATPQA
ncbi:MAG: hypothetical protein JWR85_2537 [Marmoricola sp.]|nr:hypothetical protein [Marmoricola sp.]